MMFSPLFAAYLALVAIAAMRLATRWLTGRARQVASGVFVVWLGYASVLGATGVVARYDQVPPGLAILIVPVVVAVLALTLGRPGAVLSRSVPLRLLLGFQVFRVGVELVLHHLWSLGLAPRIMTLEGGNIEILVAATAPVAAWSLTRGPVGRRIAWAWNLVGLLSLANIVARAVLSAPGPLHVLHTEMLDVAVLTYPFTFIPGFMVPLALALHVLAFRAFRVAGSLSSAP